MNRIINFLIVNSIICLFVIAGCKQAAVDTGNASHSAIPVTVSPVHTGRMTTYLELNAQSSFLFRALVKAPVTGYIERMTVSQGEQVKMNQLLFTIKTKEASAIKTDSMNNLNFSGIIDVRSLSPGLIISIEHTKGDYVAEGDQLCQVADPDNLVFMLDVPFEVSVNIKLNTRCEIVLPDGRLMNGIIRSRLVSMATGSQTERFIVRPGRTEYLPENLMVKIRIIKESVQEAISLPKTCILTDETMQSFWVMKLINDSTAVRVPVITGISNDGFVQVKQPHFEPSDLFLASGNYGLGDTAYVKVLKNTGNEQ